MNSHYNDPMHEFDLLKQVFAANRELPPRVTIPPGDDMGAIAWTPESGEMLVTVDQVAQGVHFSADTPLDRVARKAIARNVSDVAAMGCQPVAAVVATCLPRDMHDAQVQILCDQLRLHAARFGCPLIGGMCRFGIRNSSSALRSWHNDGIRLLLRCCEVVLRLEIGFMLRENSGAALPVVGICLLNHE